MNPSDEFSTLVAKVNKLRHENEQLIRNIPKLVAEKALVEDELGKLQRQVVATMANLENIQHKIAREKEEFRAELQEKTKDIENRTALLEKKEKGFTAIKEKYLKEVKQHKDKEIARTYELNRKENLLNTKEKDLNIREDNILKAEESIRESNNLLSANKEEVEQKQKDLATKEANLDTREEKLAIREKVLADLIQDAEFNSTTATEVAEQAKETWEEVKIKFQDVARRSQRLDKREEKLKADEEDLKKRQAKLREQLGL